MISRTFKTIPLGLLVGITGLVLSLFQFFHDFEEDTGLGLLFKLRGIRQAPSDAVVVSIDKESSEHLNLPNNPDKWPRSLHARLVEKLAKQGTKVVTFDVHFLEPRSPEDDRLFAEALSKARNVVIADALTANEIPSSETDTSHAGEQSIVKIIKPFAPFAQSAVATAPFVLPRIPFKVNQFWTFQTSAGDAPTFPVIAFQLFTLDLYDEFVRLFEKVNPNQAGKLPHDANAAIKTKGVQGLIMEIREIFASDPSIADRMIEELDGSDFQSVGGKRHGLLKSLVKLYGGSNRRYLNYYGPPRTITTIPYYRALQFDESKDSGKPADLQGKAV